METGASMGIGAAIAKQLAAEGASVIVNYYTSQDAADKVVSEIIAGGGKAVAVEADVSNEKQIVELFAKTQDHQGALQRTWPEKNPRELPQPRRDHDRRIHLRRPC